MKKYFTLLLITVSVAAQNTSAQLDMAFISNFSVTSNTSIHRLNWTVANNQAANRFDVERCTNGKDFVTVAVVLATEKLGMQSYNFSDSAKGQDKIMYRLKISSRTQHAFYSKIVMTQPKVTSDYGIKIMGNPVRDRISFNYTSKDAGEADMRIYSLCGNPLLNQKINIVKGNNIITIPLTSTLAPGIYVVEINNSIMDLTTTFIKQ